MQHLGQVLVLASFALTAVTAVLALGGAARGIPGAVRAAGHATRATAWLNVAISLVLVHAILSHDFSNRYVASYTDSGMPVFYLLTAFWGGEKGALLFWVLSLSVLAALLARSRRDGSPYTGYVLGTVALALLFFDVLMVFASSPFETFLVSEGPPDGSGLNPLLMNPLMAVHPPFQLAGFVAYTIPFAFAVASLLDGRADATWVRDSRPWYLFAWSLLTAGLAIGGLWAYLELGWGGFWGWDPVENAALLPWLSGTAMLHSSALELRRGMLRRWNLTLVFLTFLLTIFATFLTRSQLIQSLHSFSNSVLTPYFLYYMLVIVLACGLLLGVRWSRLAPGRRVGSPWSREGMVVANTVVFLVALFIVLWGTLLPKISESSVVQAAFGLTRAVDVGPEWFNRVVAPVGVILILLTAIGPLVPYRAGTPRSSRTLAWTGAAGAGAALIVGGLFVLSRGSQLAEVTGDGPVAGAVAAARGLGLPGLWGLLSLVGAGWALVVAIVDWRRAAAARAAVTGESGARAAAGLLRANPRRFGGHLAHIGVALAFIGFAGGAGKLVRKDVVLEPLDRLSIGGTDLIFLGTDERYHADGQYASLRSHVLAWPTGAPLDDALVQAVAAASGAASATPAPAPEVALTFASTDAAREFLATAFMQTAGVRDVTVISSDPGRREVRLAPRSVETLRIVPRSFHRLVEEMRGLAAAVGGDRVAVSTSRGDPVIVLRAADDAMFRALTAPPQHPPVFAGVRVDDRSPERVVVVPAGVGSLMRPEMRFYARSENPTTEVVIDAGILSDLYVAASPGEGSRSMSLTAMVNPLMSGVWLGSLVLVLVTLGLAIPLGPAPAPAVAGEAARRAVEGVA